jgi:hypothetical protein
MSGQANAQPQFAARVSLGGVVHDCEVAELSDQGARLTKRVPVPWPQTVVLYLSGRVRMSRVCRVLWQVDSEVGVEFG